MTQKAALRRQGMETAQMKSEDFRAKKLAEKRARPLTPGEAAEAARKDSAVVQSRIGELDTRRAALDEETKAFNAEYAAHQAEAAKGATIEEHAGQVAKGAEFQNRAAALDAKRAAVAEEGQKFNDWQKAQREDAARASAAEAAGVESVNAAVGTLQQAFAPAPVAADEVAPVRIGEIRTERERHHI